MSFFICIHLTECHNFFAIPEGVTTQLIPYDYYSIMHFPFNAYSEMGQMTIDSKNHYYEPFMFQTFDEPDAFDFLHVNLLYCKGMPCPYEGVAARHDRDAYTIPMHTKFAMAMSTKCARAVLVCSHASYFQTMLYIYTFGIFSHSQADVM